MAAARFRMSQRRAVHGEPRRTPGRHHLAVLVTVLAVLAGTQFVLAPAAFAQGYVPILGSGSTWSFNALDQWRRNVDNLYGIKVNFAPTGSTSGRNEFRNGQVDFAVSEIPYGLTDGGCSTRLRHGRLDTCRSWPAASRSCTTSRSATIG